MYIAIRSVKANGSTSFTHGRDIDHLLELQSWYQYSWPSLMVAQMRIHVTAEYVENAYLSCVSIFAPDREIWTKYLLCSLCCIQNIMDASIPRSVSSCSSTGESHTEGQLFQKQMMSEVQTNSCRYGSDLRRYWNRHQSRYLQSFRTTCTVQLCN